MATHDSLIYEGNSLLYDPHVDQLIYGDNCGCCDGCGYCNGCEGMQPATQLVTATGGDSWACTYGPIDPNGYMTQEEWEAMWPPGMGPPYSEYLSNWQDSYENYNSYKFAWNFCVSGSDPAYCYGYFRYGDTSHGSRVWYIYIRLHKDTGQWSAKARLSNTVNSGKPAYYGSDSGGTWDYENITGLTCVDNVITGTFTLSGTNIGHDSWCSGCEGEANDCCCCEGATMTVTLGGLP